MAVLKSIFFDLLVRLYCLSYIDIFNEFVYNKKVDVKTTCEVAMITIVEVSNLSQLKKFVRFPVHLYAKDPYYVPKLFMDEYHTLRDDINPAFDHCDAKY